MKRIPNALRELLDGCGLPWRIDNGGRHLKVIVGKRMATILPYSPHVRSMTNRAHKNVLKNVERAIREQRR